MTKASQLRAFAISVEQIVRLMPRFVSSKALTRGEAAHLSQQLKSGAEVALDIAVEMELRP